MIKVKIVKPNIRLVIQSSQYHMLYLKLLLLLYKIIHSYFYFLSTTKFFPIFFISICYSISLCLCVIVFYSILCLIFILWFWIHLILYLTKWNIRDVFHSCLSLFCQISSVQFNSVQSCYDVIKSMIKSKQVTLTY